MAFLRLNKQIESFLVVFCLFTGISLYLVRATCPGRHQESAVLREARAGIVAACDAAGLDLSQATMRWMLNHSAMGEGDGMISGAANLEQLTENMVALSAESGPLPGTLVALLFG